MALATDYASLQAQAIRWSGGSSDTNYADVVRDAVALSEFDMDRSLWVPERIVRATVSYTAAYESLPDDFARMLTVKRLDASGTEYPIEQRSEDVLAGLDQFYGQPPRAYAIVGAQIQFAPAPSTTSPLRARIAYWGLIPRLNDPASCTAVLATYGNVYLWLTLMHLASYADDANGVAKWGQKAAAAIADANRAAVLRDSNMSIG